MDRAWTSAKIGVGLWGMAFGDVEGIGRKRALLLSRREVLIGDLGDEGFKKETACEIPGRAEGARIGAMDLDGDGREEIVVSAVEDGMPASLALVYAVGKCAVRFERARWSLRVYEGEGGRKALLGQGWSSQSFFSGPVHEMAPDGARLKAAARLALPRGVDLFQFSELPAGHGSRRAAVIKGRAPLEAYDDATGRFRREWRSGGKLGGSANVLTPLERGPLGAPSDGSITFDLPPGVVEVAGGPLLFALANEMLLKGMVGRMPIARGAELALFRPDPAFGFVEGGTAALPGAAVDWAVDTAKGNVAKSLFVLVQGFSYDEAFSLIARYDLGDQP